jgi:hypothetical protein
MARRRWVAVITAATLLSLAPPAFATMTVTDTRTGQSFVSLDHATVQNPYPCAAPCTLSFSTNCNSGAVSYRVRLPPSAVVLASGIGPTWAYTLGQEGVFTVTAGSATPGVICSLTERVYVRVDARPPETTITAAPNDSTHNPTPTIVFASNEPPSTFECRFDIDVYEACTTPLVADSLSEGRHTFSVAAIDPAGNFDATPATVTFTVERAVIRARLTRAWTVDHDGTKVARLVVELPSRDGTVSARCEGKGCPFRKRDLTNSHRRVNLTSVFRGARLQPGAVIDITAGGLDMTSRVFRLTVRPFPRRPSLDWLCQPPGDPRPEPCSQ